MLHDLDRVPQRADIVRQQNFFPETYAETGNALRESFGGSFSVFELIRNVLITDDRSRDELREHRDVSREVDDVLLHLRRPSVNVDRV